MKTRQYQIDIKAPASKVMDIMLGKETYKLWTSAFNPTSSFEGEWKKGSKIRFLGISKEGVKEGMLSEIMELIPDKFVSIRHYGFVSGEKEITDGPELQGWKDAKEIYSLTENNGITTVTVDIDVVEDHLDYFDKTWPIALEKVKNLSE
ncbi:MAG: SRPBCC domain-containing protein [Pedobacter sp.]|nr:MAG: SRPBCC domain-containing protein [Pedobacter sp.]